MTVPTTKSNSWLLVAAIAVIMGLFLVLPGCLGWLFCGSDYVPVCGSDGKTYTNECLAKDSGVTIAYSGECTVCTDSDNGINLTKTGTVRSGTRTQTDYCSGTANVVEYYCGDAGVLSKTLACPAGLSCSNGACVAAQCSDSDSGADIYKKGTVTAGGRTNTDYCSAGNVMEYVCKNGAAAVSSFNCPKGFTCKDGACAAASCVDNETGTNISVVGTVTYGTDVFTDTCAGSKNVLDYYCNNGSVAQKNLSCPSNQICSGGACVSSVCADTDDGLSLYSVGVTTNASGAMYDTCTEDGQVKEYYCSGSLVASNVYPCPSNYYCSGGACISDFGTHSGGGGGGGGSHHHGGGDGGDDGGETTTCTDPDGSSTTTRATAVGANGEFLDDCFDDNTVREYVCSGDNVIAQNLDCAAGYVCAQGTCIRSSPNLVCTDKDAGPNEAYVAGSVQYGTDVHDDECTNKIVLGRTSVTEWYCLGGRPVSKQVTCNYGCANGACINRSIGPASTCSDSDGGLDYSTGGYTKNSTVSHTDSCGGDVLVEWQCVGSAVDYVKYDCGDRGLTCANDASGRARCTERGTVPSTCAPACNVGYTCVGTICVPTGTNVGTCTDSDDGVDPLEAGYVKVTTSSTTGINPDRCIDESTVREWYCSGNTAISKDFSCLPGTCSGDRCVSGEVIPVTECNPLCGPTETCVSGRCVPASSVTCSDTDGGINTTRYGEVTVTTSLGGITDGDSCVDSHTVGELYCDGNAARQKNISCGTGSCINGVCVSGTVVPTGCSPACDSTETCISGRCVPTDVGPPTLVCTDQDDADYQRGIYTQHLISNTTATCLDRCEDTVSLLECICVGNKITTFRQQCALGCNAGACVDCSPACTAGYTCVKGRCIVIGDGGTQAPIGCTDTDGADTSTKGHTTDAYGGVHEDYCPVEGTSGVVEYVCNEANESTPNMAFCRYGSLCYDGHCVVSCTDPDVSEVGSGIYKKTSAYNTTVSHADVCPVEGGPVLNEYTCSPGSAAVTYTAVTCPSGACRDGACVISCTDPDVDESGSGIYRQSTATNTTVSHKDECISGSVLREYTCNRGSAAVTSSDITCPSGICSNGACTNGCTDTDGESTTTIGTASNWRGNWTDNSCFNTTNVWEYICAADGTVTVRNLPCPLGHTCSGGVCSLPSTVAPPIACLPGFAASDGNCVPSCSDTDGGHDTAAAAEPGTVRRGASTYTDNCKADGTLDEYYCTPTTGVDGHVEVQNINCGALKECVEDAAGIGACVNKPVQVDLSSCTDTDPDNDPLVAGTVTGKTTGGSAFAPRPDRCSDSTHVTQSYCDGKTPQTYVIPTACPSATECDAGECKAVCTEHNPSNGVHFVTFGTTTHTDVCNAARTGYTHYSCSDQFSGGSSTVSCSSTQWCDPDTVECVAKKCVDSDAAAGSKSITTIGTVTYGPDTYTDACVDNTHVREYSCTSTVPSRPTNSTISCGLGSTCAKGRCS